MYIVIKIVKIQGLLLHMKKRILFAWVGHADLQEFSENQPKYREQVIELIKTIRKKRSKARSKLP